VAVVGLPVGDAQIRGPILMGALLFLGLGLLDDIVELAPSSKITCQLLLGSACVGLGLTARVSEWSAMNGILALVWILVVVNAVNLIDVSDGVAAGLIVVALVTFSFLEPAASPFFLAVAGTCFGFLLFNTPPASVLLGDAGTHFLGFVLAAGALETTGGAHPWHAQVSSTLVLGVPLFELFFVVAVRVRKGLRWWEKSPDHIAFRLHAAGLSRWQAVTLAWAAGAALGVAGWSYPHLDPVEKGLVAILAIGAIAAASRVLTRWDPATTTFATYGRGASVPDS
jgi:UDP-GlcNAc:undecaprenyl-phosphate GlcNAc-1-phosphate transferase